MAGAPKGNKNAVKGKQWSDAVRKVLMQDNKLDKVAEKLITIAIEGDIQAIKEVGNRIDGKVTQQIDSGGNFIIERVMYTPPDETSP